MTQHGSSASDLTPELAKAIAIEAYVYAYPLVTMDVTRRVMSNVPVGVKAGLGPANMFHHMRTYPPAEFRDVVRPNFDTLYSVAWLDMTKEPVIVSLPDSGGRYYLMPLYDMWTDAYAVPGKRTNGTAAVNLAIVPPGWTGTLPAGIERVDSPTPINWIITRTQTNGPNDYAAVNTFQDGFKVTPLSQWGKPAAAPAAFAPDPTVDMKTAPLNQVNTMTGDKYFAYAAELMKLHKPHATDWSIVARMKRLGIVPGQSFDIAKADPAVRQAILDAPATALALMQKTQLGKVANGWLMMTDTMGVYGNSYLTRAYIAMIGLGANQVDDAIYPMAVADADGKPIDGTNNYVIHFPKAELPPVDAFWSITMYDAEGFQVANPLNRFAIGDRDALKYNADGSLDIYMQNASPGADKESNWLPAPKGPLGITMRLYAPRPEVAEGRWVPPAIKRVQSEQGATMNPAVLGDGAGAIAKRVDNMHQTRFIEIFLAHRDAKTGKLVAECYNTMFTSQGIPQSKDSAPQALVEGLDFEKMKQDFGMLGASLNGPKLWTTDWTEIDVGVEREFNGIKAAWVAQLSMGDNAKGVSETVPYQPTPIARKSGLGWNKGTTVMLLDDAEGNTWILKGFQMGLKPQHTYDEFIARGQGQFKKLPPGWKFRVKTLEKDLTEIPDGGKATIMADEFFNVYDKTGPGMSNYKP